MYRNHFYNMSSVALAAALVSSGLLASSAAGAAYTWDGGGADDNWTTDANWVGDPATDVANTDTLTFGGSTRLTPNNDIAGLTLGSGSITFAAGAGSFNVGGLAMTLGAASGGGYTVITKTSTADQTISAGLTLGSGGGDRNVIMTGGGKLTLSGNVNFSNSWLFPNTTAGTIVLSGSNSGDGKGGIISAGTNQLRAVIGSNVAGTQLIFGSNSALGNTSSGDIGLGTAVLKGIQARQNTNISTDGDRDLSAYAIAINAGNVTFNGADDMTIGHLVNQGGNRDFWVASAGTVSVASGISMSNDQTGRTLYVNLTGAGGMVVNGRLHDTLHSGGLTSGTSLLRKAGSGGMQLNGNSSTYNGNVSVEAGILQLGHANALGNTTGTTSVSSGATLDLNGQTISESISSISGTGVGGNGALINSNTGATAVLLADIVNPGSLTIGGAGDITATRIRSAGVFTITKVGGGTLTTNGNSHNNLSQWDIQAGTVVLANTVGLGADRGVTLNGGTLVLSGANSNLVNDAQSFVINTGTFDLNGKSEAVASVGGTGGVVTNSNAAPATLYVGGGVGGSSTASYAGVIQDGTGVLHLAKEGTGTQTLTGANAYTGDTTVVAGTLSLGNAFLSDASSVWLTTGAVLNLGFAGTDTIASLYFDGLPQLAGTWGATGSGATHINDSFFTGPGTLTVVPEPASLGLLAICGLVASRRRRD